MRPDLGELRPGEEEIAELQLLLARGRDLITDQSRTIARLRESLLSFVSGFGTGVGSEQSKGPLTLLTHYQRLLHTLGERATSASLLISETAASRGPTT